MSAVGLWTVFLLVPVRAATGDSTAWLTDDQARDVATAPIHAVDPQPCYSTYRREDLEETVSDLRSNHPKNSVYFYRVASDSCEYVATKDGKPVRLTMVSVDCCEYGIVAVDRATAKPYWFDAEKRASTFPEFVRDEQIHPDFPKPMFYFALYRELVWAKSIENEIGSLQQLRDMVQENFQSAYSPYQRDNLWERQFDRWWRRFARSKSHLNFETAYEPTNAGARVRGYGFEGFRLTLPRGDPPPRGTPSLYQWTLLIKPDGVVERLPSKVVYAHR